MESNSLREVHSRRRNKAAAPVGALVLLLAVAGLAALIVLGVNMTGQVLDNSKEKERYEKVIEPVLMFDPPTFEDVSTLDKFTVLQSALWATMLGEKRETYTYDPQGALIVPASDVDVSCAKLFGPQITLEHQAFSSDFGMAYDYDEANKAYHIPVLSATALYTPRVDEISKSGDIHSLLVGYIPPGTAWNTDLAGNKTEPDPHKFMVYKLKKVDKQYQLIAIEDPPADKQVTFGTSSTASVEIANVVQEDTTDTQRTVQGGVSGAPAEDAGQEEGSGALDTQEENSSDEKESSSQEDEGSSDEDEGSSEEEETTSQDPTPDGEESGDDGVVAE